MMPRSIDDELRVLEDAYRRQRLRQRSAVERIQEKVVKLIGGNPPPACCPTEEDEGEDE